MGLYEKGNDWDYRDRKEYKQMDVYDIANDPFKYKLGFFERFKNVFSDDKNSRKQKLEKVLQEICDQVNTVPRGFGSLPENKKISMNGYFNIKHPDLQGLEDTTTAQILGTGNDHETNVRLYAKAVQLIDDLFYENRIVIRELCQKDPELWAMVDETVTGLKRREEGYDFLREKGHQEKVAKEVMALDKKFGAIDPDFRYKELAKSGIANVLAQAEKELGQSLNDKEKKQLNATMEKLKVYIARENLYLVPRDEIIKHRNNDPQTQPFAVRLEKFIGKHTPTQDKNRETWEEGKTQKTFDMPKESLDAYTRRALAENRLGKGTTGRAEAQEITAQREETERTP